jgi:ABC-type uncharacterized transport system substrate-binding protein
MRRRPLFRAAAASLAVFAITCDAPTPFAARLRRIGWLSGNAPESVVNLSRPFFEHLTELGYVDGRDYSVEWRIADTKTALLPAMAAELISVPVDVIVAEAGPAQLAARDARTTVPVVFVLAIDPLGDKLVVSFSHPGANFTGMTTGSIPASAKRVELLKEAAPGLSRLAVIWNTNQPNMARTLVPATENAARAMNIEPAVFAVANPAELETALAAIGRGRFDGLVMLPALSVVRDRLSRVPDFANSMGIPQAYADEDIVRAGGLMSFNSNRAVQYSRTADFVDKILNGADPGTLPVEEPSKFDVIINLTAAQRLGITITPSVMAHATEVIR